MSSSNAAAARSDPDSAPQTPARNSAPENAKSPTARPYRLPSSLQSNMSCPPPQTFPHPISFPESPESPHHSSQSPHIYPASAAFPLLPLHASRAPYAPLASRIPASAKIVS